MTVYSDFIDITIGGMDVSDYVITYQRNESLCDPGQLFTLTMTRKKPNGSLIDIDTGDSVIIKERYGGAPDKVIQGFVLKIEINAEKALMTVTGADKYIMLADYFIPERLETHGETVAYWIEYICNEAGLSVQFDVTPTNATNGGTKEEGTPLGMQTALDALRTLERKGTCYTRYDSDIDKVIVYRLINAQPSLNINSSNLLTIDKQDATKSARNVVKVWGGYRYDWLTGEEIAYNATARAEMPQLTVDQTTVVATPEVRSFTFANIVAQRILAITANLDDLATCECAGLYPSVKIGDWVYITISQGEFSYTRERQVTSINVSVDGNGARTNIGVGEKCPRVSVSPPPVPIYVTDTVNGVGVSWNAGDSFVLSNAGLTTSSGSLHGKSIAVNNYGIQMVVTAAGLYKRYSGLSTWYPVTNLPDPINESNDPSPLGITNLEMIKVVDEPLKPYTFHMIASGGHPSGWYRSYVYTTEDYGYNWKTTQMWAPALSGGIYDPYYQEHPMAPSGRVYDVWTHDMAASLGNAVTVLVSSPYVPLEEQIPVSIYYATTPVGNQVDVWWYDGQSNPTQQDTFTTSGFILHTDMMSLVNDRNICYYAADSTDGNTTSYKGSISYLFKTLDYGANWTEVHSALLQSTGGTEIYLTRGCALDQSSNSTEVRAVFWQVLATTTDATVKSHFVSSNPGGSTSYSIVTKNITLELPSLLPGESFDGYIANPNTISSAHKFARGSGFAFGCAGFYGNIRSSGSIVARGLNLFVFKFDFATETIEIWKQFVSRTATTTAQMNGMVGPSAEDGNSVYVFPYNSRLYSWTYSAYNSIDESTSTIQASFDIDEIHTDLAGWTQGGFPNYYRYLLYTNGAESQWTDFFPYGNMNKQFQDAETIYWWGDTALASIPNGFVRSTNGYDWTQVWNDTSHSPRPSVTAQHFDFRTFSGST